LKEYLNRMSMRGISRVEGKPLTTVYSLIKRVGIKAYVGLSVLQDLRILLQNSRYFMRVGLTG